MIAVTKVTTRTASRYVHYNTNRWQEMLQEFVAKYDSELLVASDVNS